MYSGFPRSPLLYNWRPTWDSIVPVERVTSFVAVCYLLCVMELSSNEKWAIERERFVKIDRGAGEALLFEEVSKIYVQKFKSDLKECKQELINFGVFLKYGVGSDVVVVGNLFLLRTTSGTSPLHIQYLSKPHFSPFFEFPDGEQRWKGVDYRIWRFECRGFTFGSSDRRKNSSLASR